MTSRLRAEPCAGEQRCTLDNRVFVAIAGKDPRHGGVVPNLKDRDLLPPRQSFAVTGYSLGGHLATVFNLLHGPSAPASDRAPIKEIVTFNGAGASAASTSASA